MTTVSFDRAAFETAILAAVDEMAGKQDWTSAQHGFARARAQYLCFLAGSTAKWNKPTDDLLPVQRTVNRLFREHLGTVTPVAPHHIMLGQEVLTKQQARPTPSAPRPHATSIPKPSSKSDSEPWTFLRHHDQLESRVASFTSRLLDEVFAKLRQKHGNELPRGASAVVMAYAAILTSLTNDIGWSEPEGTDVAVYTNLVWGDYVALREKDLRSRFPLIPLRVMAGDRFIEFDDALAPATDA